MTPALVHALVSLLPLLGALLIGALLITGLRRMPVGREDSGHPTAGRFRRQLAMLLAGIAGVIAVILTLPVSDELRSQLLSLFGLLITAMIALSSTTLVANTMAGLMLRSLGNFRAGDFIRVAEHFGRVTERGLLHTEIQTEDRDLITLPNLYLITQPVRVVLATGTLVSCELSLGYDVPRARISELLQQAAVDAELDEPFVHITELGDYSVGYRVSGFLEDVRRLVSVRSNLRARVLDSLHGGGIEIVSPAFMNQRQLDPAQRIIPENAPVAPDGEATHAEGIMFDKAETAQRIAELREQRARLAREIEALKAGTGGAEEMEARRRSLEIGWRERQLAALEELLEAPPEEEPPAGD